MRRVAPDGSRHGRAIRRPSDRPLAWLLVLACVPLFAACGSHGSAGALGAPAHVALAWQDGQSAGSATLTPFYAMHVVAYLGANPISYQDAKQPAQLRKGDCNGAVLAALTADAPIPSGTQPLVTQPDAAGGVNVAVAPSGDLWVTVLDAASASASIFACGHPISGNKQFFDLLSVTPSPTGLLLGHTLGTALTEPIVASHLDVDLAQAPSGSLAWALRSGSCTGGTVASGQFPTGATRGAIIFHAPDTAAWRLTVTSGAGAKTACGKVGS